MEPVAPRSAVHHLDSRASSDNKQCDDTQPGEEEVCIKRVNHVLIVSKRFSLFDEAYADICLVCLQYCASTAVAYASMSFVC